MQICAKLRENPLTLYKYFAEAMKHHIFFSILLSVCLLAGCQRGSYVVFSGYAQGGVYSVKADLRGVSVPAKTIAFLPSMMAVAYVYLEFASPVSRSFGRVLPELSPTVVSGT